MLRVLPDEVNCNRINIVVSSPFNPVAYGRIKVHNPEATEQSWVHVIDIVLITIINSSNNTSLWVELHSLTISVVTKLTIQNDLEETLHNLWHRAIQFVQHQDNRLSASANVEAWQAEGRYACLLRSFEVRDTTHL